MISNLKKEIALAAKTKQIVVGFNVFGYEDATAVIKAAEKKQLPTLLMLNRLAINYMPLDVWSGFLRPLIERASVPISLHLDHCSEFGDVVKAMNCGFSSVMYDGSHLPLEDNIKNTNELAKIANVLNVSIEAEIGSVPYDDLPGTVKNIYTDYKQAELFSQQSGADWIAVAIGQVHRLQSQTAKIQFDRLENIEKVVNQPLVIHGATGILDDDLKELRNHKVGKINVGTSLRLAFGNSLRKQVEENPKEFDRIKLFGEPSIQVQEVAEKVLEMMSADNN